MPRILVADDNTNIQKMVALAFEERGIDVVSVGNGEAAVRRIPDLSPDLVLADVFMPVRSGYEVCEFVKRDERFSHVPVILLVGAFDPLDEKEARRVGADGVLKKPFVPPDPLIAMVTSALEKNPKLAAELAKAREVVAPPPQPPAPVLEAPARIEPRPLPEFAEPTPEEAAQIYGFGKGVRVDDEKETDDAERKAQDGEDDEPVTAHDWRRDAADFEVPQEPGGKLAFASDEEFNAVTFPSEREVPPKRVRMRDEQDDAVPAPHSLNEPAEIESHAQIKEPALRPLPEPEPESENTATPEPFPYVIQSQKAAEPEPAPIPNSENSEKPDKSKSGGWMDMMTSSPSEYSEGGWLSSIFGKRSEAKATQKEEENAASAETAKPPIELPAKPTVAARTREPHTDELANQRKREQAIISGRTAIEEPLPADIRPAPESWFAPPPPPVLRDASESKLPPALGATSDLGNDLIAAPPDFSGSFKDPALEQPPSVRVTPEPLLVNDDEEPSEPSPFSGASEQPYPLHTFLAPVSGESSANETSAEKAQREEASHEQASREGRLLEEESSQDVLREEDPATHSEFNSSIFAAPPETDARTDVPFSASSERIPTTPPPNREALADIPFLMAPPPSPFEHHPENDYGASDPANVDAVVAKVLEKLEPQLHQLLSQGLLKPLVENLLQQELEKKQK